LRTSKKLSHLEHFAGAAGVDEVGRGCLAGPVVAAAVILPHDFCLDGIADSKLLSKNQREEQSTRIKEHATWSIIQVGVDEIDKINILQASLKAMVLSLGQLTEMPASIYIDGNQIPNNLIGERNVQAVVKGDQKIACIAAASILAKVARDQYMQEVAKQFPQYGFESHVGYATAEHLRALKLHGPCPLHRKSFSPIKEMINQPCLQFDL
jgi:ribonuclease HII